MRSDLDGAARSDVSVALIFRLSPVMSAVSARVMQPAKKVRRQLSVRHVRSVRDATATSARISEGLRLRARIVDAVTWRSSPRLRGLLRQVIAFQPSKAEIAATGLGLLLADRSIWTLVGEREAALASVALRRWKTQVRGERRHEGHRGEGRAEGSESRGQMSRPFAGLKASQFVQVVNDLEVQLLESDNSYVQDPAFRRASQQLALRGFTSISQLDGCDPAEIAALGGSVLERSVLERAVQNATIRATALRAQRFRSIASASVCVASSVSHSAEDVAKRLGPSDIQTSEESLQDRFKSAGMQDPRTMFPAQAVASLARAANRGVDVQGILSETAGVTKLETQRLSGPSVASGLKCWHMFAVAVLGYSPECTLPPRDPAHVEQFVSIFRNGGTASNYVGCIKWGCKFIGVGLDWHSPSVELALKGARKRTLREVGGQVGARFRLTETLVSQVVAVSDSLGPPGLAEAMIVSWEYLLRVQSECLPMERGSPSDATSLPPHRHSGLYVDDGGALVLRLQRRKHRPQGSLLSRRCLCGTVGPNRCPPHRLGPFLSRKSVGEKLWEWSSSDFKNLVRRLLVLLSVPDAERFSLKAFRAGKATELARSGNALGTILAAGEWRSNAFMRYVDEDAVDSSTVLGMVMDASDSD